MSGAWGGGGCQAKFVLVPLFSQMLNQASNLVFTNSHFLLLPGSRLAAEISFELPWIHPGASLTFTWQAAGGMLQRTLRTEQNTYILNYIYFCQFLVMRFLSPFCFLSSYLSLIYRILLNLHHTDVDVFMPWGSCCGKGSRKTADTRITAGNLSFLLQQDKMAAFKHLNPISPHPLQAHETFIPRFSSNTENLCCCVCIYVEKQSR